jgi:hypothetical protein
MHVTRTQKQSENRTRTKTSDLFLTNGRITKEKTVEDYWGVQPWLTREGLSLIPYLPHKMKSTFLGVDAVLVVSESAHEKRRLIEK